MAYHNNAAYDLELFDEELTYESSAAPKREEDEPVRKSRKKAKNNVVAFTEEDQLKSRKRRHNPLKLIFGGFCAAVVTVVIGFIIVGQVRLTELNQEIITAQATLEETQSIYTQNQMKLEANLSTAEIEKHATEVLGMTKASNAQKEFISLEGGDKAEVSVQKSENIFTRFIDSIKNLWS
ncbi:MAG: hypothetical protein IJ598_03640 [Ruminococcus sp.]|nr:hypothetical protein [Ruminococcus sp.]